MNQRPTSTNTARPVEHLHFFVNELNKRYNLKIPLVHAEQEKTDQSLAGRIYIRLKSHYSTGGVQTLERLREQFDDRVKQFWSSWADRPVADHDTLPTVSRPPSAANPVEREREREQEPNRLQTIFDDVLEKHWHSGKSSRTFGRTKSGPAAFGGDASTEKTSRRVPSAVSQASTSRSPTKRRADADIQDVSKKPRADVDPIRDLTASTHCRYQEAVHTPAGASAFGIVRPAINKPRNDAPANSERSVKSFVSMSTGLSEASAVFSANGDAPPGTQDTIEANSQKQEKPVPGDGPASCSQDSYGVTSSLEEGLQESFEQARTLNIDAAPRLRLNGTVHSPTSSELFTSPSDVERSRPPLTSGWKPKICSSEDQHLSSVWPRFPAWLREAPFPVAWEVTRIIQHCGVDLSTHNWVYNKNWTKQRDLRASLRRHPALQGKAFPAASSDEAWTAGLRAAVPEQSLISPSDQQVVYTASLDFDRKSTTLQLTLQPLKLEQAHRLGRNYGSDRFVELLIPSPESSNLPKSFKKDSTFFEKPIPWLLEEQVFCGRAWKAFYTKSGGSRKNVKDLQFGPEPKPVFKDRIYFFAERAEGGPQIHKVRLSSMLNWALDIRQKDNGLQPVQKLFQRIALVLSRTSPTVIFEPHQIRLRHEDVLSPTGTVMNDGVARMSPAVARQIRTCMGLPNAPSAVQGRLGSAKGMWILDTQTSSSSDEIWIETFPSQRKWAMDWERADEHHRTLEIRGIALMPKCASFNLQFLPVIEDRAKDKLKMRQAIGSLLKDNLRNELDGQKRALQIPLQFRQWTHENATHKHDRIIYGHVPFLGAMPQEIEEVMNMMLDAGFDPSNEFLKNITFDIQKRKCDTLMKKLNIKVGRSVYLYMVVDFLGVLEEDEIHVGFSTAFEADEAWSKTMLHGIDVLVARSPAHFNSDIQKVKAVFKPELADLTDVVVFSSKGNIPLADKLSGGDYDGDLAWVCWEPRIVDNFVSAPPPKPDELEDLSQYMPKDKETFRDLVTKNDKSVGRATRAMLNSAFKFNLSKSMLGACTNYKERLCYDRNSISDKPARILSTLLSNLVDQSKQGLRFDYSDFQRLLKDYQLPTQVDDPIYKKSNHWPPNMQTVHIIDYLKFDVAKPTIDKELRSFHEALKSAEPTSWDEDLVSLYKDYAEQSGDQSQSDRILIKYLKADIELVRAEWEAFSRQGDDSVSFTERVTRTYASWQAIEPHEKALSGSHKGRTRRLLRGHEYTEWALLKASTAFSMYHGKAPRFVWQMACAQLCWLKALAVMKKNNGYNSQGAVVGAPRVVVPSMYASLRPDAKFVKQMTAKMEGVSHFDMCDDSDDDDMKTTRMTLNE